MSAIIKFLTYLAWHQITRDTITGIMVQIKKSIKGEVHNNIMLADIAYHYLKSYCALNHAVLMFALPRQGSLLSIVNKQTLQCRKHTVSIYNNNIIVVNQCL